MINLDPAIKNLLIETIGGGSIVADQIEAIGQLLVPKLNIHNLTGKRSNFTLSPRMAAQVLVEDLTQRKLIDEFIKLLVEMDESVILGKTIRIEGLEYFLQKLTETGLFYNAKKRKIVPVKENLDERLDWGSLKNGRSYNVTIVSMDIVGSSNLVKKIDSKKITKFYSYFWTCLKERLYAYNGRIWSWAGDGGIIAFVFKQHQVRATRFALEIQRIMPLINSNDRNPIDDDVAVRIGMHCGNVTFMIDTGKIVSDVINLSSHLEKKATEPGFVSISEEFWKFLPEKLQRYFKHRGDFEGHMHLSSPERLDII